MLITATFLDFNDPDKPKTFKYQKTQINHISVSGDGEFFVSVGSSDEIKQELAVLEINKPTGVATQPFYMRVLSKKDGRVVNVVFANRNDRLFCVLFISKIVFYRIQQEDEIVRTCLFSWMKSSPRPAK